jgi:hypothetical protein
MAGNRLNDGKGQGPGDPPNPPDPATPPKEHIKVNVSPGFIELDEDIMRQYCLELQVPCPGPGLSPPDNRLNDAGNKIFTTSIMTKIIEEWHDALTPLTESRGSKRSGSSRKRRSKPGRKSR